MLTTVSLPACSQNRPAPAAILETGITQGIPPVVVFPLPDKLDFAGEAVPLQNYDTRESLSREIQTNSYLHSRTIQTLRATTRFFPVIEPILEKNGIPNDFKYLCIAESGLSPTAISSAGAGGLWQMMPATGKQYGLFAAAGVDERYHVEKSTEAACKYLLEAYKKFGNWTMAAASYNVGQAGVTRRAESQGINNYYDLFLPEETMRYVFRILAFKVIFESPESYGYVLTADDYFKPYTDYKEVSIKTAKIDWSAVAREHGTNYKVLRELNPWIRDYTYNNSAGRTFVIKVPNAGFREGK